MGVIIGEFEDQEWFPARLRNYQTDFLGKISAMLRLYRDCPDILKSFKESNVIVDLASGNGEAIFHASEFIRSKGGSVILTDKFPNEGALEAYESYENLSYVARPIDLLRDTLPEGAVYTMFNSLHHFRRQEVLDLIQKLHRKKKHLIFAEPLQPNILSFLKVLIATTIGCLLITPFVKPFRWDRLLLTYLLPIGLFVTFWDGITSVIKSHSKNELVSMIDELNSMGIPIELRSTETPAALVQYLVL